MKDFLKIRQEYMKDIVNLVDDDILNNLEYLHCQKDDLCKDINQSITELEKQIISDIHQGVKNVLTQLESKVHDQKKSFMWILIEYNSQIHDLKETLQYRMRPDSLNYIQRGLVDECKKLWNALELKHNSIDQDK